MPELPSKISPAITLIHPETHTHTHTQSALINILRGQRSTVGPIIISALIRKASFSHCIVWEEMEGKGSRGRRRMGVGIPIRDMYLPWGRWTLIPPSPIILSLLPRQKSHLFPLRWADCLLMTSHRLPLSAYFSFFFKTLCSLFRLLIPSLLRTVSAPSLSQNLTVNFLLNATRLAGWKINDYTEPYCTRKQR